ncbi:MAG TPA: enoyl-CoA hydratase/isomerase family protein [Nocardioidaceae bacterium]|jgi:enoyl-CoA hydratase/carnithine racemase
MTDAYAEAGLRVDLDGPVATVTLCRPETRNAQSPRMWEALADVGERLGGDRRIVVIRAEGPSFSAGLDTRMFAADGVPGDTSFAELTELDDLALAEQIATYQEAFSVWRRPDLVSIAAVNGHAVGAGFQLALACDLRVCADDARFCMRETSLGLVPDLGGTQSLVETVGYARALELCVTGRWVEADEARELGLATIVVPADQLEATVADLAAALMAAPHGAVTATKALLRTAAGRSFDDQLAAERSAQVRRLRALTDQPQERASGNKPG